MCELVIVLAEEPVQDLIEALVEISFNFLNHSESVLRSRARCRAQNQGRLRGKSEKQEERVTLTVHEPVTATFALRYLVNFAKAAPLCGAVELGLGPDAPLLVKYDLEKTDNGYMQFYLAPKIDE